MSDLTQKSLKELLAAAAQEISSYATAADNILYRHNSCYDDAKVFELRDLSDELERRAGELP